MKTTVLLAVALAVAAPAAAMAQTAASAPAAAPQTAPAAAVPARPTRLRQPARVSKLVAESDAVYNAEQRRADHGMNICIGCD